MSSVPSNVPERNSYSHPAPNFSITSAGPQHSGGARMRGFRRDVARMDSLNVEDALISRLMHR